MTLRPDVLSDCFPLTPSGAAVLAGDPAVAYATLPSGVRLCFPAGPQKISRTPLLSWRRRNSSGGRLSHGRSGPLP